jgi:hypothetical protein
MTATTTTIRTLADLKAALRDAAAVYVRVDFSDALTEFVEVSGKALLRALTVDAATGEERPDDTPLRAVVSEGELFVCGTAAFPERARQQSRPATPPPPEPSAPPATRPAKPAVHEFDLPRGKGEPPIHIRFAAGLIRGSGVLVAKSGTTNVSYTLVELPCDWAGRSFHLAKLPGAVGDDKQNPTYDVFCAATSPADDHCDCKGTNSSRTGTCKHKVAVRELIRIGAL